MSKKIYSVIKGTGSYVPSKIVKNSEFLNHVFYNTDGEKFDAPAEEIISKFEDITEIKERRYASDRKMASDLGFLAAEEAIKDAQIDKETLDYIIVGHNFGDVKAHSTQIDIMPALAARIKEKLDIKNPFCVAYDILFGCPGWVQGMIQADYYIKSGDSKRVLVIGTEILSRIYDPHDRDGMIYADGAGAAILEGVESENPVGIISHLCRTDTDGQAYNLWLGKSYNTDFNGNDLFLKMNGRKLYNYALTNVPTLAKQCIDKAGATLSDIKKVLIHQANAKMDDAILKRLFKLYDAKNIPEDIMPMTISKFGNSSVATVPVLLDHILKGNMQGQMINKGDMVALTSVGAGMNINCIIYKFPL
jgi:3-oxoacyl-[acyl-carrier-protein] synthase III